MSMDLNSRGPREGETIVCDGLKWEVTGYSTYKNDEGYKVQEWCCETDKLEAYLLHEWEASGADKWFFTRWIAAQEVALAGGASLPDWKDGQEPPQPPQSLVCQNETFHYASTTDGAYEDEEEPGKKVRKLTWDYWDAQNRINVAVELWGNGGSDCYRGAYIKPYEVGILPAESGNPAASLPDSRFLNAAARTPIWYALPMFLGRPFDESIVFVVAVAACSGLFASSYLSAANYLAAAAAAAALALVLMKLPALMCASGFGAALLAAWIPTEVARRQEGAPRAAAVYLAGLTPFLPGFLRGAYYYFRYSPLPHSFDQLFLALAPAFVAGAAGAALALFLIAKPEAPRP